MKVEYKKFYSSKVGRELEFKIYGHAGKPMIVFPSSGGRFYEYEDFGMINACRKFIDEGKLMIFTPDSIDSETWLFSKGDPYDRARRHNAYDAYIIDELVPFIKNYTNYFGPMIATGCSMGGYHSANFYFKHPDVFDTLIALSGIYDARFFVGENIHGDIYFNSPVDYIKNISDENYLKNYRLGNIIICSGQGNWEEDTLRDTYLLAGILKEKNVPAWIDIWGHDVDHDWPWWRVQIAYHLEKLL